LGGGIGRAASTQNYHNLQTCQTALRAARLGLECAHEEAAQTIGRASRMKVCIMRSKLTKAMRELNIREADGFRVPVPRE
jgi:hypothetical protein